MAGGDRREAFRRFTTGVALITTQSRRGPNVMAAEWTFQVSYDPFLIAVHVAPGEATHEAIAETGEFGVNVLGEDQVDAMAFAGHFSKHSVDKLTSTLFDAYPATKIRAPLLRGALLNAECRVVEQLDLGDHTAFVGEVVAFSLDGSKDPIVLHRGARRLGSRIERRPVVAVAATPGKVGPGGTVRAAGEFMAPDGGRKALTLALRDAQGREVASGEAVTDVYGAFEAHLVLPADAPQGAYLLVAVHGEIQGSARLRVGGACLPAPAKFCQSG